MTREENLPPYPGGEDPELRKLRLTDVLAYREALRERRNRFITESSEEFGEVEPDEAAELLKAARRER
jgi:hypothetical protein